MKTNAVIDGIEFMRVILKKDVAAFAVCVVDEQVNFSVLGNDFICELLHLLTAGNIHKLQCGFQCLIWKSNGIAFRNNFPSTGIILSSRILARVGESRYSENIHTCFEMHIVFLENVGMEV